MDFLGNPTSLTSSALGVVVIMLASANVAQWREIRRLNESRLNDMMEIGAEDRRVMKGITAALNSLRRKTNGKNNEPV